MNRNNIKLLIETSPNAKEADKIISSLNFETIKEKLAFLKGMFGVEIVSKSDSKNVSKEQSEQMDYFAILETIINDRV